MIDVVASIDALIEALSVPLSDADERAGWDDRLRKEWRTHFVNLREAVVAGKWPRAERHHLMRWLNCESIGSGPLAERFASFQQQLRMDDPQPHQGTTGAATRRFLNELGIPGQQRRRR